MARGRDAFVVPANFQIPGRGAGLTSIFDRFNGQNESISRFREGNTPPPPHQRLPKPTPMVDCRYVRVHRSTAMTSAASSR